MLLVERTPRTATIKLSWCTMLQRPGSLGSTWSNMLVLHKVLWTFCNGICKQDACVCVDSTQTVYE